MALGTAFTLAGYLVGAAVFWWAARLRRVDTEGMAVLLLCGLGGGVMGARVTEWLLGPDHALLSQPWAFFDPETGGRSLVGGILCGWLAVAFARRRLGIHRSSGDLFALALPAGEMLGRVGCFFNGCCYGTPSTVPWAVYQHGAWRHPSQLYMAFLALATFGVLSVYRSRLGRPGDLFMLYLLMYSTGRFGVEFFRSRTLVWAGISLAQIVCLGVAVVVAQHWVRLKRIEGGPHFAL